MKDEIRSVLQMAQDGKITHEQAVELIAALGGGSQGAAQDVSRAKAEARERASGGGWTHMVADVVRDVLHGGDGHSWSSEVSNAFFSTLKDNAMSMSKVEAPLHGSDSVFADNRFTMSHMSDVRMSDSTFGKNTVDASKVCDVKMNKAKMLDCTVLASACDDLLLDNSTLLSTRINSSNVRDWKLLAKSQIDDSQVVASQTRDVSLQASTWSETVVRGAHVRDLRMDGSTWQGVHLDACKAHDITVQDSTWHDVLLRAIKLKGVTVVGSSFTDVLVAGGDSWRRQGFHGVRFENCTLNKVLFAECCFTDVVIKDVTLTDVKVQKVTLKDQAIVGNEAFLKAVGLAL